MSDGCFNFGTFELLRSHRKTPASSIDMAAACSKETTWNAQSRCIRHSGNKTENDADAQKFVISTKKSQQFSITTENSMKETTK